MENKAAEVDICAILSSGKNLTAAFAEVGRQAVLLHQMTGVPLVEWRDGRIVHTDPFTGKEVDPNDPEIIARQRPIPYCF